MKRIKCLLSVLLACTMLISIFPLGTFSSLGASSGNTFFAKGIDVSHWQGNIDWKKVKNAGIQFAIIKAGGSDAGYYTDSKWEKNYKAAKEAGVPVGAYYFAGKKFTTAAEGKADAERFIKMLKGKQLEYPVYIDIEAQATKDKVGITKATIEFCKTMENAGFFVGIYASAISGFVERLEDNKLQSFAHWVAQYASRCTYSHSYGIWQYSSTGKVSGISGDVDMNYAYIDYPSRIKNGGNNGFGNNIGITSVVTSNIKNFSASFTVNLKNQGNVEHIGLFYSKTSSLIDGVKADTAKKSSGNLSYYEVAGKTNNISKYTYDTSKAGSSIKFDAGTTYYYKMVVSIGGKWYVSSKNSFTTIGKPSNISNLRLNKSIIGKGSPVTATWNAASGAEQYRITLSKDGVLCEDNLIAKTATYTVPADFTAEEGSYEIGVIAKNAYAESASAVTSRFTVMPDVTINFDVDGDVQTFTVPYDGNVVAPAAPTKEGHTFVQWESADADVAVAKAFATINNVKTSATYTASWNVNEYPVTLIDSVSNKTLRTFKQDYGTELNLSQYENNLPTHTNYTFAGWSVPETYQMPAEEKNIYAIYKWNEGTSVSADITAISREKSNSALSVCDGYSIDVEVRSPSIVNGATSQIVNGRVVVVLKTDAGRLLSESESAAFVLYPNQNGEVSKTVNVFIPFVASTAEGFATVAEAYVVNNYRSAGLISNVAHDENLIAAANVDEWMFSATRPVVGQNNVTLVDPSLDYDEYNYTVTTKTTAETPKETLEGFSPISSSWVQTGTGKFYYVKKWPKLGSAMGCGFDNTTTVGKNIYDGLHNEPKKNVETSTSKITVTEREAKAIYYHWCRNQNTGHMTRNVEATKLTSKSGNKYHHFHAFLTIDPDDWNEPQYSAEHNWTFPTRRNLNKEPLATRDKCTDSEWWAVRLPTYQQTWTQYNKKFVQQKIETTTGTVRDLNEIPQSGNSTTQTGTLGSQKLNTTVQTTVDYTTTHYYAFKKAPDVAITHEDKNFYDINVSIGADNAGKDVIVYVYKTNVMSDATMEYLAAATVDGNGNIVISNAQMLEACSVETGDFTIAVALKGETDAMVVGNIEAPKPVYTVKFVANTDVVDQDGNIVLQQIGEDQHVSEGQNAVLPELSAVPEKQGYHFIGWSQSATNVSNDLVVEAEYEKNEYTVVFVDWEDKKVELQKCAYGEMPEIPELPDEDIYTDVEWIIEDGNDDEVVKATDYFTADVGVTSDMVISTKYSAKTAAVNVIQDPIDPVNGEDVESEELPEDTRFDVRSIGDNLPLSEYEEEIKERVGEDIHFYGWLNYRTGEPIEDIEVVENIAIVPQYSFDQDVETPTASVATGEYNAAQTIALSCDTENAAIYYTLDDTDPAKSSTAILYESPFTVATSCRLRFIAMALGYNNSVERQELYAINTPGNARYHIVKIYSNAAEEELSGDEAIMGGIPESATAGLVRDGNRLPTALFESITGFDFQSVYYDAEHEDEFILNVETVTESVELYAVYTRHCYTVNFVDEDETLLDSKTVAYMDAATPPEPPTRDGYVFVRWDGDYEFITEDMTLKAVYIPESENATIAFKPNRASKSISVGSSLLLNTVISTTSDLIYDVEWSSDNSYVASVDDNGNVRGESVGTATVTATLPYTGASASVQIIVTGAPEYSIMLTENSILDIDTSGFIRRVPAEDNTVAAMRAQFENNDLVFYDVDGNVLGETALVGTGTVVKFFNEDGEETDAKTFVMTGDMNQDGYINNRDVAMITRYLVDKETADLCQYAAIDVNGDGSVNNRDASMLSRYLVGKEVI